MILKYIVVDADYFFANSVLISRIINWIKTILSNPKTFLNSYINNVKIQIIIQSVIEKTKCDF